ncbi:DNA-binding transcriptional regulator, MerR family [Streptoalloteichus hindustanus]|uniref:DNA-binding transcriptional regulator, MerR family n=2 Tax=Streptoalloteichus hindustanus TaxID=2017 RepID=A0A1M4W549_STRHI|nr:MerR family transcriptional regulator [Streptoalloteichus hindustanus]SHE76275.1 DNA-binding transcriptional regulator, MerR family [Streptoalloteichus hindustanus]
MRIGELARRTGVSERLLRYYEEQGLLRPERRSSGYRQYRESDVVVVRRIRTLLAAGLSTATIARVLPCMCDVNDRLIPCSDLVQELRAERARMDRQIDDLVRSRGLLDEVIGAAPLSEGAAGTKVSAAG